jgi:hypothetical protein
LVWLAKETRNSSACDKNGEYRVLELPEKHLDPAEGVNGQLVEAMDLEPALNFLFG